MKQVRVPASKSDAHRAVICAALSETPCEVKISETNDDIEATMRCVASLINGDGSLDAGESGSTLRFIVPLAAALGVSARIKMHGRLSERPMEPLAGQMAAHGADVTIEGDVLTISGRLAPGEYTLPGDVSSQFISGLLMALPLTGGESRISVTGKFESAGYVDMTLATMKRFGVAPVLEKSDSGISYVIKAGSVYRGPDEYAVEGDWSAAANWMAAGVLDPAEPWYISGLTLRSAQGDKELLNILLKMGADVEMRPGDVLGDGSGPCVIARPSRGKMKGIGVDAAQIPDIIPIIALVATQARGETVIYNAGRLRLKESDRIASTAELLRALGADVVELEDGMIIKGKTREAYRTGIAGGLKSGAVSSEGDHRIAMMAAVASTICDGHVVLDDHKCVSKSYPSFWDVFHGLGLGSNLITVDYSVSGEEK